MTFPQGDTESEDATKLSYRDVTSPINMQDYKALDSSGGKGSSYNSLYPRKRYVRFPINMQDYKALDSSGGKGNSYTVMIRLSGHVCSRSIFPD